MATIVSLRRETVALIGSDKVEGTAVYGADDQKIGTVQRVVRQSQRKGGLRSRFVWRLSWDGRGLLSNALAELKYDSNLGGYRVT